MNEDWIDKQKLRLAAQGIRIKRILTIIIVLWLIFSAFGVYTYKLHLNKQIEDCGSINDKKEWNVCAKQIKRPSLFEIFRSSYL